jgi:hypothetical protein
MIGSKLIAHGTAPLCPNLKERVSHVALLVNSRWVHESTGSSGVRVLSYEAWSKINTESARVSIGTKPYQQLADIYRDIAGRKYDIAGVLYLGLKIGLSYLGFKIPKVNKWESKNRYFCCEALGYLTNKYYGMSAPIQILEALRGK